MSGNIMHSIFALFFLTVTRAIPLLQSQQEYDENGQARSSIKDSGNKKQLLLHGPDIYPNMAPYSDGQFDAFGHHLPNHINHEGQIGHLHYANMIPLCAHQPYRIHHHEYQFHAPDIDYWWPHHWPSHLPPPFPFHKDKDSKNKDKKEKEKQKDKKKGKKSRK